MKYKKHLAATLFADVLRNGLAQEETTGEKESIDTERKQTGRTSTDSSAGNAQPDKDEAAAENRKIDPSILEQWEKLKEKHPDTVLLFRKDDSYEAYKEDAGKAGRILGVEVRKLRTTDGKDLETAAFQAKELDMFLPKLIRGGCRVAICDGIEPKPSTGRQEIQAEQEGQAKGMKR